MGIRADFIKKHAPEVRKLFYGNDGYHCKDVQTYTFNRYISDNPQNIKVLEDAMENRGISLVVSPTGSGKTTTLLDVAETVTGRNADMKVIIALPTRPLAEQYGKRNSVYALVGGSTVSFHSKIIATTYEKLYEVLGYIRKQKALGKQGRYVLILDECHFLVSQIKFRKYSISDIITSIEKNVFDSTLLMTATPMAMPLFRCNKCIEFESESYVPVMDRIEIEFVDDVVEYVKNIDTGRCFPFVRMNDKKIINRLTDKGKELESFAKLTSDDKYGPVYNVMVDDNEINGQQHQGIIATSFVEVGLNITEYPDNTEMIVACPDWNMNLDSIEQFFNRIRRTGTKHVECARIILPKLKAVDACLLDGEDKAVCTFHDVQIDGDTVRIADTAQMDSLPDGKYKMKIRLNGGTKVRNMRIMDYGTSGKSLYCKDGLPVRFEGIGFRELMDILESNYSHVLRKQTILQAYTYIFEQTRKMMRFLMNLNADDMQMLEFDDEDLIEKLTQAMISREKELGDCLEYKDGEIVIDKRVLFMISYRQFQRQYLYHADRLKEELESRMKVQVIIKETGTPKAEKEPDSDELWEGIEDVRIQVVCDDDYYGELMHHSGNRYSSDMLHFTNMAKIRRREPLWEEIKKLDNLGMSGGDILKVVVNSRKKAKVTKYKNAYMLINNNRMLQKFSGEKVRDIPLYDTQLKDKLAAAVYCYLVQKGKKSYSVSDALAEEIIAYYKQSYPSEIDTEKITVGKVKKKVRQMYRPKGKDTVRNELRTNVDDIFNIVNSDYK